MRRDRGFKIQKCFVVQGKAYFTVKTATQAIARRMADHICQRSYIRSLPERSRRFIAQKPFWLTVEKRLYNRLKPIVTKVFKENDIA
jgi:hypothetical protein